MSWLLRGAPVRSIAISPILDGFVRACHSRQLLGLPPGPLRFVRTAASQRTSEWIIATSGPRWRSPQRVFTKHYTDEDNADVDTEFRALAILHNEWRNRPDFQVPRPLVCDPALRCIVMDYSPGVLMPRRLLRWLLSARAAGRSGLHVARTAGAMLAALQHVRIECVPRGPSTVPADARYRRALALRPERAARAGVPATLLAAAERVIDVDQLLCETRLVTQHSDFAPWNIIIDRNYCATLVDLHNLTDGVAEYDLAYFATALDLYRRFGAVRDSRVAALKSAFLEGYHEKCRAQPPR
jgi:hypothetical protein